MTFFLVISYLFFTLFFFRLRICNPNWLHSRNKQLSASSTTQPSLQTLMIFINSAAKAIPRLTISIARGSRFKIKWQCLNLMQSWTVPHTIPTTPVELSTRALPLNTKTRFSESRIWPMGTWTQLQVSSVISNGHFKMLEMSYSQLLLGTFIFLDEDSVSGIARRNKIMG